MAELRIENVPVTRVFHEGRGAAVKETWTTRDDREGSREYACWFDAPHGLREGDVITVVGSLGVKVDTWTDREGQDRHTPKVSLNGAKVIGEVAPAPVEPYAPVEPASEDVWPEVAGYGDDSSLTPF